MAGQNNIKVQIPSGYSSGPNIDNMKVEGYTKSPPVVSSFRNPPHFMSLISDYSPYGIGEQTLRDAQYETDAVLDHYFYEDNGVFLSFWLYSFQIHLHSHLAVTHSFIFVFFLFVC